MRRCHAVAQKDGDTDGTDWGTYVIAGGLIAADLILGGPTGEGIAPAMLLLSARQAAKASLKSTSKIWKNFKSAKNGRKTNGEKGSQREYYEWDHTHGDIEVYDSRGRHKGSMNPETGNIYKPPVKGRRINL
ncbi:colicin E3/pyocin S6 family cytotoxin [Microbulbifer sp. 2205BS26-8]|uniref:colicin E3/pyocin S6 family cytotoxin n=1 Tax=Microbulbifer sp. 2205BS26-8 TaxID=3064386 RepID=UPI00273D99A3|nr:colicin E3/pyocin S6 family cytotoxin [Microbulbifer sp. 2205BS26-8]MDP5210231.1 colicin E3/pyocin S6 family cytotoxin [Microbulbifer sp. 2205BS26-8]